MLNLILLLTMHQLSFADFLQTTVIGPNNQDCTPPDDDNPPDACPITSNGFTSLTDSVIECEENFDCCTCKSIYCGVTIPCEKFIANGDQSAFYVGPITIYGDSDDGADIDCNGDKSCEGTKITGTFIKDIKCGGDGACARAQWILSCHLEDGCSIECDGDMACISASMVVENVKSILCGGDFACAYSTITIHNPMDDFELECGGVGSCEGLELVVMVPQSSEVTKFEGINCGTEDGCLDAVISIINYSPHTVEINELSCEASGGCVGAYFSFTGAIEIDTCKCGDSGGCLGSTGLDECFENVKKLECTKDSCFGRATIVNPAKDFELICDDEESCNNFDLTIIINNRANDYPITDLKGVKCAKDMSCKALNFNIINEQTGVTALRVKEIKCDGINSCLEARFRGNGKGNVVFEEIKCDGNCGQRNQPNQCLAERWQNQIFCGDSIFN